MRLDLVEKREEFVDDALQVRPRTSLRHQRHIRILDHARERASKRFAIQSHFSRFDKQRIAGEVLLVVPAVPELCRDLPCGGLVELAELRIESGFDRALAEQA